MGFPSGSRKPCVRCSLPRVIYATDAAWNEVSEGVEGNEMDAMGWNLEWKRECSMRRWPLSKRNAAEDRKENKEWILKASTLLTSALFCPWVKMQNNLGMFDLGCRPPEDFRECSSATCRVAVP